MLKTMGIYIVFEHDNRNPALQKPSNFMGVLIIMLKTMGIYIAFEHDDRNSYEFTWFLKVHKTIGI